MRVKQKSENVLDLEKTYFAIAICSYIQIRIRIQIDFSLTLIFSIRFLIEIMSFSILLGSQFLW